VEEILSLAKRVADQAEVYFASAKETPVSFEANRLKQIRTRQSTAVALRLIKGGKLGFAASSRLDNPQALVAAALETAQFGAQAKFELPTALDYPPVEVYDPKVEKTSLEQMVQLGQSLIDKVRAHTPEVLCDARVNKAVVSVQIANSRGGHSSYKKSLFSLGLDGNLIRGTDILFVEESQSSCHTMLKYQGVAESVITQLELAKNLAQVNSGNLPVVFTPRGVANSLMSPLAVAFNGKLVLQGASPLGQRGGECVFDPRLSLWDDATQPFRPHSSPCDDEGIPCRRLPLIEQGVVSHFYYDLQTAGLASTQSTGHGSRATGGLPIPMASALIVDEGDTSFENMVRDMKEGLVVEVLMGAEQGNILAGDFSGNVLLGYKVEHGELVGRVKDTMVSGNIYSAMRQLAALGNKATWVGAALKTPPLYFPSLAVASKS
jgi:PmbA protein